MTAKKQASKMAEAPSKSRGSTKSSAITFGKNELRIKYSDSHDLLDKLFGVTQSVSRLHTHQLRAARESGGTVASNALDHLSTADIPNVLGPSRAYDIVTECAGQTDLTTQIGDIPGLDPRIFQACVQKGVLSAGYKSGGIPASSSNKLWDVVVAIQSCPPE
jgi:hypothetical protein